MFSLRGVPQRLRIRHLLVSDPLYAASARWFARMTRSTPAVYEAQQLEKLRKLITAYRQVGLCREEGYEDINEFRQQGDLARLPLLTRDGLRALYPRLRRMHEGRRDIRTFATGGATGEPVQFLHSRRQYRLSGGCGLHVYKILGWRPGIPRVRLWGSERDLEIDDMGRRGLDGWIRRATEYTISFSGFLDSKLMYSPFCQAVMAHPGCAVYGYASMLVDCATYLLESDKAFPTGFLATVWTAAEQSSDAQRDLIEHAFGVRPHEHYASRECSSMAATCVHGTRHVNPRYIFEAVDSDTHHLLPCGETGSLLVTDLFNDVTPFIRYEIGDLGALDWRDCSCGRSGRCLTQLAGRTAWLIRLPSGAKVSTHVFNAIMSHPPLVHRYRVVRLGPLEFTIEYTGKPLEQAQREQLEQRVSRLLDNARVQAVQVDQLDLSPSGKLLQYVDHSAAVPQTTR